MTSSEPAVAMRSWFARAGWVGPAALGALYCVLALRFLHVNVDDAFILYRYAANLAGGRGLTYTMGTRVEGSTTVLYVAVLAAVFKVLQLDVVEPAKVMWMTLASKSIGAACGLGTLAYLGRDLRLVLGLPRPWVLASLLSLVLCENFVYSTTNGLETGLVCLLYTAMASHLYLASAGGETDPAQLRYGVVAACALVLARADGALFVASYLGSWTLLEWTFRRPSPRALAREAIVRGGPPLATLAALLFAQRAYFGRWLPQSYYVKMWSPEGLGRCLIDLSEPAIPCSTFTSERLRVVLVDYVWTGIWGYVVLALASVGTLGVVRGRARSGEGPREPGTATSMSPLHAVLTFTLPAVPLLAYVVDTGDWMPGRRMLMHFMPPAMALLTGVALRFVWKCAAPVGAKAAGAAAVAALVLGTAWTSEQMQDRWTYAAIYEFSKPAPVAESTYLAESFSILRGPHDAGYYLTMYREFWADIRGYLSRGDSVAVFESGSASLALGENVRVIDLSGLNDERMSEPQAGEGYLLSMGRIYLKCGDETGPDPKGDYLVQRAPKFIIFDTFQIFWCKHIPTTLYGGRYRLVAQPHDTLGFFAVFARSDLNVPGHGQFPSLRCSPACMKWLSDPR